MEAERMFRQPERWTNAKNFNSSVVYAIDGKCDLVVATDIFPFEDDGTVRKHIVPGMGEIKHAILTTLFSQNGELAAAEGVLRFGAKPLREYLEHLGCSDAHNPLVWRRSVIVKADGSPIYAFETFVRLGIFSEEEYSSLTALARDAKSEDIYDFLLERYKLASGKESYKDFIRSAFMCSS